MDGSGHSIGTRGDGPVVRDVKKRTMRKGEIIKYTVILRPLLDAEPLETRWTTCLTTPIILG